MALLALELKRLRSDFFVQKEACKVWQLGLVSRPKWAGFVAARVPHRLRHLRGSSGVPVRANKPKSTVHFMFNDRPPSSRKATGGSGPKWIGPGAAVYGSGC